LFTEISLSEVNDIAQVKPANSNGDETQIRKQNIEQKLATRFSERLVKYSNDRKIEKNICGEDDDPAASKTECKYCKQVYGYSEFYQIGGYLRRHQGTKKCGINFLDRNNRNAEDDISLENSQVYQSAKRRLIYPFTISRSVYSTSLTENMKENEGESDYNDPADIFTYNHEHSNISDNEYETYLPNDSNQILSEIDVILHNDEEYNGPQFLYINFQKLIYQSIYGQDCIYSKTIEDMVALISSKYRQKFSQKLLTNIEIYNYWSTYQLTHRAQKDMLKLFNRLCTNSSIPRSLNGIKQLIHKAVSVYKFGELHIPYPTGWEVEKLAFPIDPIMVYLRDPMELIAELFVNPQIMFKYRSHIHFRYYNKSNNPIISPVHADLMTSEWCRKTEDLIIKKSVDGNILPLIFNSDGAQLGANINNKTTPLMCTTGNFSDDLIDQDISKCVIGYLPDLKDYKANIWNHLKRIYRSESAVIEQIQLFDRLVERECWNEIIKCVSKHWESGVKLMVLGQGIKLFFPCIAFFVGDEPQQRRQSGLQEGNCIHSCIYCTYSSRDGVYNHVVHRRRDYEDIKYRCNQAEKAIAKLNVNEHITPTEQANLRFLREQNIQPYSNPLYDAPLGYNNNVFTCTPPDTLHLFCAGLMKSLTKTIVSIVHGITTKNKTYINSKGLLDYRISNFDLVHDMPHVYWTKMKGGIMRFAGKTTQELGRSSGSFGGFRSSTFISLLFQIYYSIGFNGEVVPNKCTTFSKGKKSVVIEDIQGPILKTIYYLLDIYFDVKRREWTESEISILSAKLYNLYAHYIIVWTINQTITTMKFDRDRKCQQRNPHKMFHLPALISRFGSLRNKDTSSWERFHKTASTGTWDQTSKRQMEMSKEMAIKYNVNNYSKALKFLANIHDDPINVINCFQENEHDGSVFYEPMKNYKKYYFNLNRSTLKLIEITPWKRISHHEPLLSEVAVHTILMQLDFWKVIKHFARIRRRHIQYCCMFFVGAIRFFSDPKSLGDGALYATTNFANRSSSRYDFVLVRTTSGVDEVDDDDYSLSDGRRRRNKADDIKQYKTILAKLLLFICIGKN